MSTPQIDILIMSHGDFCESALRTAAVLGANTGGVAALPMFDEIPMEQYEHSVAEAVSRMPAGSIVFVDLFGGTPFNKVVRLIQAYPIHVISGYNLPMLIEAMSCRDEYCGQELVEAVLAAGAMGVRDVNQFLTGLAKA